MHLLAHQLFDGIVLGGVYALIAISLTFIYSVSKQLQLAHGDVMVIGAYVGYFVLGFVPNLLLAILAGVVVGGLVGLLVNDGIFRWLRRSGHLSIVAGLALSAVIEEALRIGINQGRPVTYPSTVAGASGASVGFELLILALALALGVAFQWFLVRSKHGRALRATADNPEMAQLLGISSERTIRLSFVIGSAMCASAGVLLAVIYQYVTPFLGASVGLTAVAIILFGGLGNVPGAVLGAFVMALSQTLTSTYISSAYRDAIAFAIIVVVVFFRPNGLFGRDTGVRA
jgi:branched-chain amino acid transport system permease protein